MQYRTPAVRTLSACLIAAGLYGCGGDNVTQPNAQGGPAGSLKPAVAGNKASNGNAAAVSTGSASGSTSPDGAKYTIVCAAYTGNGHIAEAKAAKDKLIAKTGRSDFYVIHDEGISTLYFGYYKALLPSEDPVEAKRCDEDFAFIRSLTDSTGRRPFQACLKQPLRVADPEAPAEYDLTKLDRDKAPDDPTRRYWSIAIAAYTVDANPTGLDAGKSRKQLAVESVLAARKAGYEAYYYNGDNVSTVCIGAWPRTAIAEQERNDARTTTDSDQALIVATTPLPPGLAEQLENSGRNVKVYQPKIDITDPSMLNVFKQFPQYSVNGALQNTRITDPHTGQTTVKPQPTFLVEIPRLQPSVLSTSNEDATTTIDNTGPATVINPLGPGPGSSGGKLRSLTK